MPGIPRVIKFDGDPLVHVEAMGAFNILSTLCKGYPNYHFTDSRSAVRGPVTCLWCAARSWRE